MRSHVIAALLVFLTGTAAAQQSVLNEAQRAYDNDAPFEEIVRIITPAMSDAATANNPQTYFIPGMAAFDQYTRDTFQHTDLLKESGNASDEIRKDLATTLLRGYDYLAKALSLEAPQSSPKYSDKIIRTIAIQYENFLKAGFDFWNLKDYARTYRCWDIFVTISKDPRYAGLIQAAPDATLAELMYNMGLTAWQEDELQKALDAFIKAKNGGYVSKNLYDYAIAIASQLKDSETVVSLSEEAIRLYGHEDASYIGHVINDCLEKHDYDKALDVVNNAIASYPDQAEYYLYKGIIFDQEGVPAGKRGNSREWFEKAVRLNPDNPSAQFMLGNSYYNEAADIDNNASTDAATYDKVFHDKVKPFMMKAIEHLEQSYKLNNDNTDALRLLESAYYFIQDKDNLARIKGLLKK